MVHEVASAGIAASADTSTGWPVPAAPITVTTSLTLDGTQLRLAREISCGDEAIAVTVCWSRNYADAEAAEQALEALAPHEASFLYWSTGAMAIGSLWLAPQIDDIVARRLKELADEREELAEEEAKRRRKEDEERAYEEAVHVFFKERKGGFVAEFTKGLADRPFWTIRFEEAWERDRFWDWACWQLHRHDELAAFLQDNPPLELERRLLREMLVTEQAVKKQGLGAGGRRPLRFWRGSL